MTKAVAIACLLLMTACHDRRPPAPTAQQSDQLNDAENMLNTMAENGDQQEAKHDSADAPKR